MTIEIKQYDRIVHEWHEDDEQFPDGWDNALEAIVIPTTSPAGPFKFEVAEEGYVTRFSIWSGEIPHYIELFQAMLAYADEEKEN